jgi:hypothetical protein
MRLQFPQIENVDSIANTWLVEKKIPDVFKFLIGRPV